MLNTPISELPRERCLRSGADCLSLRECLALVLGPCFPSSLELARRILERPGPGLPPLYEEAAFFLALESSSLDSIPGLGPAGKARLLAVFELARRYGNYRDQTQGVEQADKLRLVPGARDLAGEALARSPAIERSHSREWLGFVPVARGSRSLVGALCVVERGVRTHVNVDPAELFARVLALRPRGFILFHNHPSGDLSPSEEDLDLTRRVARVGAQLGIRLLGHWIVTARAERWLDATNHANAHEP